MSEKFAQGYVYDAESRLYYLQSRYYDPSIGRFINADSYASTGQGVLGHNMFTYCNNNPISNADPAGQNPLLIAAAGGVFGGAMVGLFYSCKNDLSLRDTLITMLGGAIAGGFGAAAGILSGVPQVLCTLLATVTSGFTAEATGGEFGIGLVVGFVGTILGTKIPTASFTGADLFWGNAVATAAVSVPSELVSQSMHKDFEALQEILGDDSRFCTGGGSSLPLGLRGMGTGAA